MIKSIAKWLRVSAHAQAEMIEEAITLKEVYEAVVSGRVIENYATHRRGACRLVGGRSAAQGPFILGAQPVSRF